jgi:hypothetical protein
VVARYTTKHQHIFKSCPLLIKAVGNLLVLLILKPQVGELKNPMSVVCLQVQEIWPFHPMGESLILLESGLSPSSSALSSTQSCGLRLM